ncbi:MAG TPA: Gfo/Idh/MocA family oxidoreductase [Verrucomicrobiae bacterium]|jgi:predicted dehydrogenase
MKPKMHRRQFVKRAALAVGAASTAKFLAFPGILSAREPSDTLRCVQIGCGGRGETHLEQAIASQKQKLVAMVDPYDRQIAGKRKWFQDKHQIDTGDVQAFSDYRVMFDKIAGQIDVVFIAAPNHHHAPAAMLAMQAGKSVYCEKPLTHDISEARKLREASLHYNKVATQMGNQGHCEGGYRRLCEFIWGGVIGNVTETHSWTDRANGGIGPRPPTLPVPEGMHWDSWIGPAPYRDYHSDLHPHEWHGWYDFGNGSIGNMGCHVLEGVYWALHGEHVTSVEMEYVRGGSDERYPLGSRVRWDLPAREGMPPLKAYWYEGLNATTKDEASGGLHAARGSARNFPPIMAELKEKYPDEELDRGDSGSLYIGDKGIIFTQTYGGKMHVLPLEKMNEIKQPPISLPRPNPNPFINFIETCRAGRTDTATPFEYGARLTEFTLLGNLAQHAGPNNLVEWDSANMKVTNIPELNKWLKREDRQGWTV